MTILENSSVCYTVVPHQILHPLKWVKGIKQRTVDIFKRVVPKGVSTRLV